jgi:hypothetical protein
MGPASSWLTLAAVLSVGVSLGMPLFLYFRQAKSTEPPPPEDR